MAERTNKGQFQKGKTGNPGGRPSVDPLTRQSIKKLTPKALKVLEFALDNYKENLREGQKAAEVVLAYDIGKPKQAVEVSGGLQVTHEQALAELE